MTHDPPEVVVTTNEPEVVIPALLDYLHALGGRASVKAVWIIDVYSEVLSGLLRGDIRDPAWIPDLSDCILKQLNSLPRIDPRFTGFQFGYQPDKGWGWRKITNKE